MNDICEELVGLVAYRLTADELNFRLSCSQDDRTRKSIIFSMVRFGKPWGVCRHIPQIPQYIRQIPHNAPFCNRNVHTCVHFWYKMVHCGIWDCCIVGFVGLVYCSNLQLNIRVITRPLYIGGNLSSIRHLSLQCVKIVYFPQLIIHTLGVPVYSTKTSTVFVQYLLFEYGLGVRLS